MKILVLGASGLLGNTMFRVLSETGRFTVFGTVRRASVTSHFSPELARRLISVQDVEDAAQLIALIDAVSPNAIVNCTALPRTEGRDPGRMISIFSVLPRRLQQVCRIRTIRLIHISSDGVFSGARGGYTEDDLPDATDPYGIAKLLGEVDGPGALSLRTSILGPELGSRNGLLTWFLQQEDECRCYTRSIFSGFPTVVLAQIVRDMILPNEKLQGVYHVASQPISKFDLLALVRQRYGKNIRMIADDSVAVDRSLCADRFNRVTGYVPPSWPDMVAAMHSYKYGLKGS